MSELRTVPKPDDYQVSEIQTGSDFRQNVSSTTKENGWYHGYPGIFLRGRAIRGGGILEGAGWVETPKAPKNRKVKKNWEGASNMIASYEQYKT